jgi:hypothetical protein
MIKIDYLKGFQPKVRTSNQAKEIWDNIRKKWIDLTPEEFVRQAVVAYFITELQYSKGRIAIEKQLIINGTTKRYDIVIFDVHLNPFFLIECKAPSVEISASTFNQAANYQSQLKCKYMMLTNGITTYCLALESDGKNNWIQNLPKNTETSI